ncbi:MAG: HNH endonuclease signature motif containing protein [Ignavibacteria bacterium]|nr:HNH endonuclease signature motif containing protein [Ignavibacteria bacterium]
MINKSNKYRTLLERQDGKCLICGKKDDDLVFEHIIPRAYGGDKIENNLVLVCKRCNMLAANKPFKEYEFVNFLSSVLEKSNLFRNVNRETLISSEKHYRADIVTELIESGKWKRLIIELKSFPTFTSSRINDIIIQLNNYRESIKEEAKIVLAFPGMLTQKDYDKFRQNGIEVWDRNFIATTFKDEIKKLNDSYFKYFFSIEVEDIPKEKRFIQELNLIPPGKKEWYIYQKLIGKILDYLFSTELSTPISELADKFEINRRDFILRNYSSLEFWKYLRERYLADFIVIDAKNYVGKIKKEQILQIANYLKVHGTGLFAIIVSRNGEDNSSYLTRREKWMIENKMVIILDDSDIEKMILAKASTDSPEEIIKQKIEEFRLKL